MGGCASTVSNIESDTWRLSPRLKGGKTPAFEFQEVDL